MAGFSLAGVGVELQMRHWPRGLGLLLSLGGRRAGIGRKCVDASWCLPSLSGRDGSSLVPTGVAEA